MKKHILRNIIFFGIITSSDNYTKNINIYHLTLEQKIGQLFMVAAVVDEEIAKDCMHKKTYRLDKKYIETLITDYYIGGIIYLGKSDVEKQIQRTTYFQSISVIPLLIGQDLEPGRVGASRLPHDCDFVCNQKLGKRDDEEITYQTGREIGDLCNKLGVHINFAPVADINNNPNNPVINDRSFGNTTELVTRHAIAFAQGLYNRGIIACAKHFPGHGDTNVDSHYDLPLISHDKSRLHEIELYPFKKLIAAEIPAIMIGHLEVPAFETIKDVPSSLSKRIVTDLLQKKLGFTGLIITDALDMHGVTNHYYNGQAELHALLAGNDILLCPVNVPLAVAAIKQAIIDNIITEQEIDKHVEKILNSKNMLFNTIHLKK
ncbi:MAG TPA: glycoside hydrolase family 3 N-terminal domain-containing protein [Candidatus Babeliales bacterium]|nr:glycoside hydrolase family 3 N-terminal domain-containing protein [Candidatus Babeliales bacterium]